MNKIKNEVQKKLWMLKTKSDQILRNERGDGGSDATSLLMMIAIAVIIGGIILGLLTAAIPDLWGSIINKIKSTFSL